MRQCDIDTISERVRQTMRAHARHEDVVGFENMRIEFAKIEERAACLESALRALRREDRECWCNAARGSHSAVCKSVRMLMRKAAS